MSMSFPVRFAALLAAGAVAAAGAHETPPPAPFGAVPSARQLAWHELEAYAFVHFSLNTFTDREWGYGDESPELFAPTAFDADALVATLKSAGLRGLVLTAKHHDGFCLWPTRFTTHSIAHSPYRNGRGDIVGEVAAACRRTGLAFGVYLSPWDRHQADYGTPVYREFYRNQLQELLTNYGPVFEVWFDGANGGDGYYGGARETRRIDRLTYYDWPETWRLVRAWQPDAVMFSDAGPDVRWVGNEKGSAGDPCWSTIDPTGFHPGQADPRHLERGDRHGPQWLPAEVDVSIRPGWFYHEKENAAVKTPAELYTLYLNSVGRGANLILNVPPDRSGRIAGPDALALTGWKQLLDETFAHDLAGEAQITASAVRGADPRFGARNVADGRRDTYWSTDDGVTTGELVFEFSGPQTFNLIRLREYLPLGQRIDRVAFDWDSDGKWQEFATATSIGAQRLLPIAAITTRRVRLRVTQAAACPALSEVGFFLRPAEVASLPVPPPAKP